MITSDLIKDIRKHYKLNWQGIHGVAHWARVRHIGLKLAKKNGANPRVVEAFAFIHDSCRHNDGVDAEHGQRAVHFARGLLGNSLRLTSSEFDLLAYACQYHTFGYVTGDITVLTCWDADRLDLGRVDIIPNPARLCTDAAKDEQMIRWAYQRSKARIPLRYIRATRISNSFMV